MKDRWLSALALAVLMAAGVILFIYGPKPPQMLPPAVAPGISESASAPEIEATPAPEPPPAGVATNIPIYPTEGGAALPPAAEGRIPVGAAADSNSSSATTPSPALAAGSSTNAPTATTVSSMPTVPPPPSPTGEVKTPAPSMPATPAASAPAASTVVAATPAPAPRSLPLGGGNHRGGALRVLAPAGHFPEWMLDSVRRRARTTVNLDTYADLAEARRKLSSGRYDVMAVSYQLVPDLVAQGKLAKLAPTPNFPKPDAQFTGHFFDPDNAYTLPYAGSLYAVAYRGDAVSAPIQSWAQVPAASENVQIPEGDVFASAVRKLATRSAGSKVTVRNRSGATAASEQKNGAVSSPMPWGASAAAPVQVDTIAALRKRLPYDPNWKLALPSEGAPIELYCVTIGASTPVGSAAAAFIANVFDPATAARLCQENHWMSTSRRTTARLPEVVAQDPLLYPPKALLDRCIFLKPERKGK